MATCDRCGPAVAARTFVMVGITELAYCGHCTGVFMDRWVRLGYPITVDSREKVAG